MPPSPSRPKHSVRLAAERKGRRGEALAALWLQLQLSRIVERRFKTPVGEIDLVADGDMVELERGEKEAETVGVNVGEGEPLDERDNVTLEVTDGVAVGLERGENEAETVGEVVGDFDVVADEVAEGDSVGAFVAAAAGKGWT